MPGYGYAKISKSESEKWEKFIRKYLLTRQNLYCVFLLVDSRHEPQKIDLDFMEWLAEKEVPFVIVFTKADKLNKTEFDVFQAKYAEKLLESWEEVPQMFTSSSDKGIGRDEILDFIEHLNKS